MEIKSTDGIGVVRGTEFQIEVNYSDDLFVGTAKLHVAASRSRFKIKSNHYGEIDVFYHDSRAEGDLVRTTNKGNTRLLYI